MGHRSAPQLTRYLPQVLVATFIVAVCPSLAVWFLRATGILQWWGFSLALGIALSTSASYAGAAYWKTRAGSEDLLFGELMIWGWLRRRRVERRLSSAAALLGLSDSTVDTQTASTVRQVRLVRQMATALEAQDPDTHGHSRRVARHAAMIAKEMGLPREQINRIRAAAAVHDVGKVNTPLAVLHHPGRLSDEQFEVVKRHPVDGAEIVSSLGDSELTAIVRHHHERLDGTGYPAQLAGSQIPVGARIIAVADTFDAITSRRPYRRASPHKKALDTLDREAGTQLDPGAVRAFRRIYAGRRPLAIWAVLTSVPERLFAFVGADLNAIAAGSAARVAAAAGTAVVGGAALVAPTPHHPHPSFHNYAAVVASSRPRLNLARLTTPLRPNVGARPTATGRGGHPMIAVRTPRSAAATRAPGQRAYRQQSHRSAHLPGGQATGSPIIRPASPPAHHGPGQAGSPAHGSHQPHGNEAPRAGAVTPAAVTPAQSVTAPRVTTAAPPAAAPAPISTTASPSARHGNSANAPGHSPSGPGNSPNAPGHATKPA